MNPDDTEEYISRIVKQYSAMLLHLSASRLDSPADAEDAVQEAFLKLLTAAPVFRDAEHEKAWLIRTTLNIAYDYRRRTATRNQVPLEDDQATSPQPEISPLLSAVRALPDKYSAVIHLHYYEGYSINEIAKLLGLLPPTVGTRLARGRKQLQQLLKEDL
ncbi:MAG: sigma-70 family RNA polymerase sigma factor [Oscillospiraceae bacterium]|nr:sigma-70 family RNA polymerase sigma factor [Oscillospiraceae bacterium]